MPKRTGGAADDEESLRWKFYETIPQGHWEDLSGRQSKSLRDQERTYGIPFGGAVVNLRLVVRAFHDFLAANAPALAAIKRSKLRTGDELDPLLKGPASPALEDYRRERALIARIERLQLEKELVSADDMRALFGEIAAQIRSYGDWLQKQGAKDQFDKLQDVIEAIVRRSDELQGTDGNGTSNGEA